MKLLKEVTKMKKENPIQKNPSNPRNPEREIDGMKNIPEDKEEPKQLVKEIEALAIPRQGPVRTPKKSDNIESDDGKRIMDEIEEIGKRIDTSKEPIAEYPLPITPDGTGPHGKGFGPGKGKRDGSGMEDEKEKESISVKEYFSKNKTFQHQVR